MLIFGHTLELNKAYEDPLKTSVVIKINGKFSGCFLIDKPLSFYEREQHHD